VRLSSCQFVIDERSDFHTLSETSMSAAKPIRKKLPAPANSGGPLDVHAVLRARRTAWRVPELARLLSLGRRTLYDLVDTGQLSAIRIGTAVRISPADAAAYIAAQTTGTQRNAA